MIQTWLNEKNFPSFFAIFPCFSPVLPCYNPLRNPIQAPAISRRKGSKKGAGRAFFEELHGNR
jgi:hypothetical protein